MKHLFLITVSLTLTIIGCTKSDRLEEDNGCIERVYKGVTDHTINSVDLQTVHNLFIANGIDDSRYRYFRYNTDILQTRYPPYTKYDQKTVRVDQYTNGLRIFTGDLVYNFLNNNFNSRGGNLTSGTSLNTSSQLTLGQIRKMFLDHIEEFDHAPEFKDSCFKAEFGYFNLNAGTGNSQEFLVKAWRVTLKNRDYPVALYEDNHGKLIYYDNGIRTFK